MDPNNSLLSSVPVDGYPSLTFHSQHRVCKAAVLFWLLFWHTKLVIMLFGLFLSAALDHELLLDIFMLLFVQQLVYHLIVWTTTSCVCTYVDKLKYVCISKENVYFIIFIYKRIHHLYIYKYFLIYMFIYIYIYINVLVLTYMWYLFKLMQECNHIVVYTCNPHLSLR